MSAPAKPKKISRKEVSKLSPAEQWELTKQVYSKLRRYMAPFRQRLLAAIGLSVLSGLFSIVMLSGMKLVFSVVLNGNKDRMKEKAVAPAVPGAATQTPAVAAEPPPPAETKHIKGQSFFQSIGLGKYVNLKPGEHLALREVLLLCLLIPLLMLVRGLLGYFAKYFMLWVGNRVLYQLRNDVFRSVLNHSLGYFNKARVGDLIQTVFNQTRTAQQNAVQLSTLLIEKPVTILSTIGYLLWLEPVFTLCAVVVFPLCIWPIVYVGKRVRKAGAQEEEEAGTIMVTMHESFAGIRVVKSHGREEYEVKRFDEANNSMLKSIMRWSKAMELVGPLVETVASCGIALGLVYAYSSQLGPGDFIVLFTALMSLYPHAKELSRVQLIVQKCIVATSSVFAVMDEEPEVVDAPGAETMPRAQGNVCFKDVSFAYTDPKGRKLAKAAVQHVNLSLEPGRLYALVGPSGAGKSTLFSLLLRFYDIDRGAVLLDGKDIRSVTQHSLRENIGVVTQDTFLFHDSIKENIRYGRLDATDDEIIEAAKRAHLHDFILTLKAGYDTVVGDAGGNLSGGQKQRVSIARAILRNAPVLLLDEATSALDPETERNIKEAVHTLTEGKTVIAIAHRLSTVMEAHEIIVMDQGSVVAKGTHQQLLEGCELYQRLHALSFQE